MPFAASVHCKAIELTKLSVEITATAGAGHPTSAASPAHLITILMYDHMRWDPERPGHPASDRLILSEGHAVPVIYAVGADIGIGIGENGYLRPMTREDAMDGDVKNSTCAQFFAEDEKLKDRYFEGRFAEQNMISADAGCRLKQMYVRKISKSARKPAEVLAYLGLTEADIVQTATSLVRNT